MQSEPTQVEPPKRRRRWSQFSLRSLMIVVTLFCVAAGWFATQARAVRDRKAALYNHARFIILYSFLDEQDRRANWPLRQWLGDVPIEHMVVTHDIPPDDFETIRHAFPEAMVLRAPTL